MLLKAELLNGESKIISVEGTSWNEAINTLERKSLQYEYENPRLYSSDDIYTRYLNSKGIKCICTLAHDEELEIVNKLEWCKALL